MRIEVPFLPPAEYSPNSRSFWAEQYQAGKEYHDAVFYYCVSSRNTGYRSGGAYPFLRAKLTLTFVFPQQRRRDAYNLLARFKPGLDAVVDAGLILDDDVEHLVIEPLVIEVDKARAPLTIINIEEVNDGTKKG